MFKKISIRIQIAKLNGQNQFGLILYLNTVIISLQFISGYRYLIFQFHIQKGNV